MKYATLILAFLFTSCASTVFYDRKTGKPIAKFTGDMTDSRYRDGATSWDVQTVSHSSATRAGGDTVTKAVAGFGAAALLLK